MSALRKKVSVASFVEHPVTRAVWQYGSVEYLFEQI